MLQEVVRRADSWPVTEEVLAAAVSESQKQFMPVAIDDAKWLNEIARWRDCVLPSIGSEDVNRLTRFLDIRFVLYFTNGKDWYDVHPLIRDEVATIIERQKLRAPIAENETAQ